MVLGSHSFSVKRGWSSYTKAQSAVYISLVKRLGYALRSKQCLLCEKKGFEARDHKRLGAGQGSDSEERSDRSKAERAATS